METDLREKSREPCGAVGVQENVHRRADLSDASPVESRHETPPAKRPGRPPQRWRFRVVRIDAQKYPQFLRDPQHAFASMAAEARIAEIDAFCARLRSRARKKSPATALSAAA